MSKKDMGEVSVRNEHGDMGEYFVLFEWINKIQRGIASSTGFIGSRR